MAEYLQSAWQDRLGITVTMSPIEDSTYSDWRASRETQQFGVYTGSWGSDFADASNWFNQNFTSRRITTGITGGMLEFDQIAAQPPCEHEHRRAQPALQPGRSDPGRTMRPLFRSSRQGVRAVKPWVKDLYFQPILSVVHLRTIKIAEH